MKRMKFIDISRAFAMIFIVLGHTLVHSNHCSYIFKFLYSFHVVLFFILSGYTFKIKHEQKFSEFLKNKFIRIMLPYFIWAIVFLVPYVLFGQAIGNSIGTSSSFDIKGQLINVLYGTGNLAALKQNSALWFLPALFTMEITYYFILSFLEKRKKLCFFSIAIIIAISYITNCYYHSN